MKRNKSVKGFISHYGKLKNFKIVSQIPEYLGRILDGCTVFPRQTVYFWPLGDSTLSQAWKIELWI